jgi:cytidine deaminase
MNPTVSESSGEVKELYKMALLARERAYCPYSGYKVGAAIQVDSGKIYTGCNVENSSYGATVCAERVAIQKAISEQGEIRITAIMVVTDSNPPWPPCGMCRQVIAEFGQNISVYTANLKGELSHYTFQELFPHAFTPSYLSH